MPSTRAGDAFPVLTAANSCSMYSTPFSISASVSSKTSSGVISKRFPFLFYVHHSTLSSLRRSVPARAPNGECRTRISFCCYQGTHFLAANYPFNILRQRQIKNNNRNAVVHAKTKCRRVHDFQPLGQCLSVGDRLVTRSLRIGPRVAIIDSVDFGSLQNHLSPNLARPQRCRRVSRE